MRAIIFRAALAVAGLASASAADNLAQAQWLESHSRQFLPIRLTEEPTLPENGIPADRSWLPQRHEPTLFPTFGRSRDHVYEGALIGAVAVGGAVGALYWGLCDSDAGGGCGAGNAVLAGLTGAAVGALAGALIGANIPKGHTGDEEESAALRFAYVRSQALR
jgi:hypothetical protein